HYGRRPPRVIRNPGLSRDRHGCGVPGRRTLRPALRPDRLYHQVAQRPGPRLLSRVENNGPRSAGSHFASLRTPVARGGTVRFISAYIPPVRGCPRVSENAMIKFLLWCILFVLCWPLALLALIAYPLVWLLLIPFRLVGIAVGGALELVSAIIFLPVRLLRTI